MFQNNGSAVSDLNDRLNYLEGTIRLLKAMDAGEQTVRFGGLRFSTISDSMAWLDKNPDSTKFGYFTDVYNLCILVARDINGETDYCQKIQTAKKPGIDNTQEFEALTAFKSAIPDLFSD